QWEAAAGIDAGFGPPFDLPKGRVARWLREEGPAAVGKFAADLSHSGVSDVAGNGKEWTRRFLDGNASIHDENGLKVILAENDPALAPIWLRGFSYFDEFPTSQIQRIVKKREEF